MPKFSSLILDVDSTLSGIEGIDWIAERRDPDVARKIALLTADAMAGKRTLSEVYGARLEIVKPAVVELIELARAYWDNVAPGAVPAIARMLAAGVRIDVVSSGFYDAIAPFATRLGLPPDRVHAVQVEFDGGGNFSSYDATAPLVAQGGKRLIVESLRLRRPILAVGDGITDAEIRPAADAFAAFTGFVRREPVVGIADFTVASFAELERLVLASEESA